jgi:hypothetical protein
VLNFVLTPIYFCAALLQALRVLRAIKPLRALTRSAGMQLIFKSLTLSLAAMGNVSIVVMLFFLIFAILGVQVGGLVLGGLLGLLLLLLRPGTDMCVKLIRGVFGWQQRGVCNHQLSTQTELLVPPDSLHILFSLDADVAVSAILLYLLYHPAAVPWQVLELQ